jgi:hypothetical protein
VGADTCANGDSYASPRYAHILQDNPAEYDGTITSIKIYPNDEMDNCRFGMMELTSAPIGGASESFKKGAGGDYDTTPDSGAGGACRTLTGGVDYTAFSCDEGEYAGMYWYGGHCEDKTSQSGNTYRGWYEGNAQLESTTATGFTRQDGRVAQFYFVNTL